jgi:protein-tyrosine phosphatase
MTEPRTHPERVNLTQADDPRDVVHRAVASLAQGGCVAFSSEGVLGVAASALRPAAVERACRKVPGWPIDDAGPLTLLIRGADELGDWVPGVGALGERLARRAWPGPVTLIFPRPDGAGLAQMLPPEVRAFFSEARSLALQVPGHPFVRDVLRLSPGPIALRPIAPPPGGNTKDLGPLLEGCGCGLVVETEPEPSEGSWSVVRLAPEGWQLVRPGSLDEAALTRLTGTIILFICTGNTCRSPMAEALCKLLIAERLGCEVGGLESRGFVVLSAGMAAVSGMPAAANAVDVVGARGGSLQGHQSRKLTADLVRQADLILTMTGDHLETLLDHAPEAAAKTRLLHPAGDDVADPVGADRETYRRTAEAIESYLVPFLDALGV